MDYPQTAEALALRLSKGHKSGNEWKACCPAHDDQNPSLGIRDSDSGKILLKCYSQQCTQDAIIAALRSRGLWPAAQNNGYGYRPQRPQEQETRYHYRDAKGSALFDVVRQDNGPKNKRIFVDKLGNPSLPNPRPLYNLAGLQADPAAWVLVVEGEKACHAAMERCPNWVAVTSVGGTNAPQKTDWAPLAGRHIVIWPDHDEPGEKYAETVSGLCQAAGAEHIAVIDVPEQCPTGWDIADPIPAGVEIEEMLFNARGVYNAPVPYLNAADLIDLPDREIEWLVEDMIPAYGAVSMLVGKPKAGKSTLSRHLAISVAQGTPWLDRQVKQGPVLYLFLEDRPQAVKPHMLKLGIQRNDPIFFRFAPPEGNPYIWLEQQAEAIRPVLIVIDTLIRFFPIKDMNSYSEVQGALQPLSDLAQKLETPFLLVHHARKSNEGDLGDESLGSQRLLGMMETMLVMKRDGTDRRSLATVQREGQEMDSTSLIYRPDTERLEILGAVSDIKISTIEEDIVAFLRRQYGPVSTTDINKAVSGDTSLKSRALNLLVESGEILKGKEGRFNVYEINSNDRFSST